MRVSVPLILLLLLASLPAVPADGAQLQSVPAAPSLSVSVPDGRGLLALSWTPAQDRGSPITGYLVERGCTHLGETRQVVAHLPSDALSFLDEAREGHYNCYRVAATSTAGTGWWSNTVSQVPRGGPTAPFSSKAVAQRNAVHVSWGYPEDGEIIRFHTGHSTPTTWRVYASASSEGPFALLAEYPWSLSYRDHIDSGLANGERRYYRLVVVNGYGEGGPAEVSARAWDAPSAPGGLAMSRELLPLPGSRLTWSAPADDGGRPIARYDVYVAPKDGPLRHWASTTERSYKFLELPHEAREYAVLAVNEMGAGPLSERLCSQLLRSPALGPTC